ncbi:aldo/keto reductase [Kitasatospora sp. MMS16-BH015]|uniref:aldo/keto reductase n=1 Tax=Kitasatospora sp. MMS16-BH015 TaxID=2018025 RepID=UPI000CA303F8|nr:aldo/keto reductase [Kitasatospora sp. MMS16-BH015]AUG81990.1 aldo/keto reductase [Kitasatospora sp. MMS16-BH015]
MTTRRLGRSTVRVGPLALGAAPLGNLFTPVDDTRAAQTVHAAWAAGVRHFDTAPHYGLGLSERRLGAALRELPRAEYVLSTKVGRLLEPLPRVRGDDLADGFAVPATHRRRWDFSADGVLRSIEASLERLGLDRIDLAYLHDPDDHAEQALTAAYPALERLRAEGVLGAIGIGMNQAELPARFVRETDLDVVLLAGRYSLLDQRGLAELLPLAAERGVSVVIGGVFNSGLLADPRPEATFDYTTAPAELLARARELQRVCAAHGVPLRAAALRFPFGHPAVAAVLVGARSPAEAADAGDMIDLPVPDALWADLKERKLLPDQVPTPKEAD